MLRDKTILVISPQSWGKMQLSKHHYAKELAKRGNRVYFLNPPNQDRWKWGSEIHISNSSEQASLFIVSHTLFFPYNIRFRLPGLFRFLMTFHVNRLIKKIGNNPDIIWSFDIGNLYPFSLFPKKSLKVFHPVDEPLLRIAIRAAEGADFIFSVTREILEKYKEYKIPGYFINHGVAESFIRESGSGRPSGMPTRVGISGNFLRPDLDRPVLSNIIRSNPDIIFECWGSYKLAQSNIGGGENPETTAFINDLLKADNVIMHGVIDSGELSKELNRMDAFLICYDVQLDQSKGTNYHKVMEYLSTGKVIISNNITTYAGEPELICMVPERDNNKKLPELFRTVIHQLEYYNSKELQQIRYNFAAENTYAEQLNRIESILYVD